MWNLPASEREKLKSGYNMCGITGLFRTSAVEEQELMSMNNSLQHRGPDGYGIQMFRSGGIGHRRLSIIDLSTGGQPISNEDDSVWITFNGEVYNFAQLRAELISFGHKFKTNSDTEVIIHGYEQWGYNVLQKLRGMFAFAIVDCRKKLVFSARDHFGIKPFFYYLKDSTFAFASELQAIQSLKEFDGEINLDAIDQYLWLQYIPAPATIYKNVYKLKPAHYIVYHFNGKVEEQTRYWNIDFSKKSTMKENEWLEEVDSVLRRSVEAHLVSDVPFGAFLSGGIDSTLIVSYMSKILKQPVKTFSIGFDEDEFSELPYSEVAAKKYGTEHHIEIVKPDALAILPELVKHYGEPFGDSSAIPTYYVCRLAKQHVTMVLSGDGGDECFAGYGSYQSWIKFDPINYRKGLRKKYYNLFGKVLPSRFPKRDSAARWMQCIEYFSVAARQGLWKKELTNVVNKDLQLFGQLMQEARGFGMINKVQYMDMKTYMNYDILTKVDVASMMHSLEVRTPLIDKNVWEFAATMPEGLNLNFDVNKNKWEGKQLLKKILSRDFNDDFIYRKKMGFAVPIKNWFSEKGALRTLLNDYLASANSEVLHYFEKDKIQQLIQANSFSQLWLLLFLEEWLRNSKVTSGSVSNKLS